MTGTAMGAGALAQLEETIVADNGSVTRLEAVRQAGGTQSPIAFAGLATQSSSRRVAKTIRLDTADRSALLAQISELEQSFATAPVPEPGAIAVFAMGLGLVAAHLAPAPQRLSREAHADPSASSEAERASSATDPGAGDVSAAASAASPGRETATGPTRCGHTPARGGARG